jgi:CPA2 family monovalent cation:H+ antiporter-2
MGHLPDLITDLGIERNNERILNPDSTTVFEWGDVIWIVGEKQKIEQLMDGDTAPG